MTSLATNKQPVQTAKQWLYSVRSIERRKRAILLEITDLKAERETIFDASTAFYGGEHISSNKKSEPTLNRASYLCDKLTKKLDALLSELEHLSLKADAVRDDLNLCFEEGELSVQEFEALFYYFFEGMSNEEVAAAMYYSVEMVYKLKASALRKVNSWRRART